MLTITLIDFISLFDIDLEYYEGQDKIFLLMLPQQRPIPIQHAITSPTATRTKIHHPSSKNTFTPALPISPQNIHTSAVKSFNNKTIPQSLSTNALTALKNV